MRYLTANEVLIIHSRIIEETGGSHGVRDVGLFQSALERPKTAVFGTEPYKTVYEKAAAYLEALARFHVFVDGNKRTAVLACARFLYLNGYVFAATNRNTERFAITVARGNATLPEIVAWIKKIVVSKVEL